MFIPSKDKINDVYASLHVNFNKEDYEYLKNILE